MNVIIPIRYLYHFSLEGRLHYSYASQRSSFSLKIRQVLRPVSHLSETTLPEKFR